MSVFKISALAAGQIDIKVSVRAKNEAGRYSALQTFTLRILGSKPIVKATVAIAPDSTAKDSITIVKGGMAYFSATVFAPFGGIDSLQWTFGDGSPSLIAPDSNTRIGHLYDTAGAFAAVFKVKTVGGNTVSDTVFVKVTKPVIAPPSYIGPANNDTARITTDTIRLVWHAVAGAGIAYNVYYDYQNTIPNIKVASLLTDTSLMIAVKNGQAYYWAVETVSPKGTGRGTPWNFIVKIGSGNNPPSFTSKPSDMTAIAGTGIQYLDTVHAVDEDGIIRFAFVDSIAGMRLVDSVITWTPAAADTGKKPVSVVVKDDKGATDTLIWTIDVVGIVNTAPRFITKATDMTAVSLVGKEYIDTVHATDIDKDTIRYSFKAKPAGMVITDSIITWNPAASDTGAKTVTAMVTDNKGAKDSLTWTIMVTKLSSDATLSSLAVSAGKLLPSFDPAILLYYDTVEAAKITMTPKANNAFAGITVNGKADPSGTASDSINLVLGVNVIRIKVTSQDSSVTKSYEISVMRNPVWEFLGNAGFSAGAVEDVKLKIYNGTPYVAFRDLGTSGKATVMKYASNTWSPVGAAGISDGAVDDVGFDIGLDGTLFVAYKDSANGNKATVMKNSGNGWTVVGGGRVYKR
jgi:hypothetical protein